MLLSHVVFGRPGGSFPSIFFLAGFALIDGVNKSIKFNLVII